MKWKDGLTAENRNFCSISTSLFHPIFLLLLFVYKKINILMENNSLSPKLKWDWVSTNSLRNLLHLESSYKSEPLAVIPFYCCTTMRVESLFRLIFSINSERQGMGMPTCVPIWKEPSLRSSLSEHCCSRRGWWWGRSTGPMWGSSARLHGPADCSTCISAGRLLNGLQNHPDENFKVSSNP